MLWLEETDLPPVPRWDDGVGARIAQAARDAVHRLKTGQVLAWRGSGAAPDEDDAA